MDIRVKLCPACGKEVESTASFCSHCGTRIEEALLQSHAQAAPTPGLPESPREMEVFQRKGERTAIRFGAFFVDMVVVGFISALSIGLIALLRRSMEGGSNLDETALALVYVVVPVFMFLYFVLFEGTFGTTLGKLLGSSPWQLAVVRKDGARCGLGRAAIRAFLLPFEANLLGAIVIWATTGNQRIGDLLAGTLVVDRRKPHKIAFLDGRAVFELLDGRRFELARISRGKIINWLRFHKMKVEGAAPDGRPIRLTFNFTMEKYRMDRLRDELESAFQVQFVETIEWWRLIVLAAWLCIVVSGVIVLIASLSVSTK